MKKVRGLMATILSMLMVIISLPIANAIEIREQIATATANDGTTIKLELGDLLKYDPNINWSTHQMYADGRMAYCVNPKLSAPSGDFGSDNLVLLSESNEKTIMFYKTLYYCYGGQGFESNISAFGGTMKNLMDSKKSAHWLGAGGNSLYYLLTHRVLSKINGDSDWSYALTSDWISSVNEIYEAVKKAPNLEMKYNMYLLNPKNGQQNVIIMQDKVGNLEIIKDSSNHSLTDNNEICYSLKGAVYSVTHKSTKKQYTVTMDTKVNGNDDTVKYKGVLKNIPVGEYIVKETKAPKGYTLDNKEYTINVKASTTETANTQLNLKENPICWQTDILIRKISENNIPISNAEFTIKFYKGYFTKSEIENGSADSSFKRFWKLKSDINGEVKLEGSHLVDSNNDFYYSNSKTCLPLGTITIQETKAPNGFVKDDTLYVQQIKPNTSNTEVQIANIRTIINTPNTYYELVKTSDSGVVANMKFKIYRGDKVDENKYWKTVITDTSGKISEKIEIGTYTFDEISGDDYEKPSPKTITVTAENTRENPAVISFRNISKDGHLKICKTSNDGNIANISFEIYNTSNELVGRYTTDENGLIVKDIAPGTYRIHEIIPEGYAHISDQTVEVKANRTRQVTFRNVKTGYKVQIIKDTDFYDAGPFTCKIEGLSNNIELSVEIDTFEPTIITLEKGKYRITELLTEDEKEYWVADEPQEFIVDDTDELITVTVKNHEKTGKVKVIKTASDTKVDNLQFSLYGISNAGYEVKYRYATTDKDGIALFDNIPVGTYTLEEISSHSIYEVTSSTDMNARATA